jgi:hypothetical protein
MARIMVLDQNLVITLIALLQLNLDKPVLIQIMLVIMPSARPVASNKPYTIIEYGIKIGMYIYHIDDGFQKERWLTSLFYGSSLSKE